MTRYFGKRMKQGKKGQGQKSKLEQRFYINFCARFPNLPQPVRQHRFHDVRLWRFDFAWPEVKVAVEIQGGSWIQGGHNRGIGQSKDLEKQRTAVMMGWRILPFNTHDLPKKRSKRGGKNKNLQKTNLMDCVKLVGRFISQELEKVSNAVHDN